MNFQTACAQVKGTLPCCSAKDQHLNLKDFHEGKLLPSLHCYMGAQVQERDGRRENISLFHNNPVGFSVFHGYLFCSLLNHSRLTTQNLPILHTSPSWNSFLLCERSFLSDILIFPATVPAPFFLTAKAMKFTLKKKTNHVPRRVLAGLVTLSTLC